LWSRAARHVTLLRDTAGLNAACGRALLQLAACCAKLREANEAILNRKVCADGVTRK
jgi:hypothetical protein